MTSPPTLLSLCGRLPKRVVIIGGGESAWMAAALLSRALRGLGCRVTIVSGGRCDAEFHGESTQPSILRLLANLQADEHDFLRSTGSTWQLATQYSDWAQPDRDFWRPMLSVPSRRMLHLIHGWHSERLHGRLLRPLHSYALHWSASLAGKGPSGFAGPSPITTSESYAFQMDGQQFAGWLRDQALRNGVEEITGTVATANSNGRGGIAQLKLTDGAAVAGDLFIVAAGSDALQQRPGNTATRESGPASAPINRVLTMRRPARRQKPSFVRVTGLADGWLAVQSLASSEVCICATHSELTPADTARAVMVESLAQHGLVTTSDVIFESSFVEHTLLPGRLDSFWHDNVVTIGHAACQLDPILSAGRHLVQLSLELLLELFPERSAQPAAVSHFNTRIAQLADDLADAAQLHYHLSQRNDSAFWARARGLSLSAAMQRRLELFAATAAIDEPLSEGFQEADYWFLLVGCGRLPKSAAVSTLSADPADIQSQLRSLLKSNEAALKDLALHEDLLDWIQSAAPGLTAVPLRSAS